MSKPRRTSVRRDRGRVRTVVADAGYWSNDNAHLTGIEVLIAWGKTRM